MPDRYAGWYENPAARYLAIPMSMPPKPNKSAFDEPFQNLITEAGVGQCLGRVIPWPCVKRSMLTIALLAATGNFDEIAMHIRATANTGASPEDVMEALLHVAVYAGVPRANHAIKIARQTYEDMGVEL